MPENTSLSLQELEQDMNSSLGSGMEPIASSDTPATEEDTVKSKPSKKKTVIKRKQPLTKLEKSLDTYCD